MIRLETRVSERQVWMMGVNVTRQTGMGKRGKEEWRGIKNRNYVTQMRRLKRSLENFVRTALRIVPEEFQAV